jgi:hypothetical protein
LNVTKANVWQSIAPARSFFARASGIAIAERTSCGTKASRSRLVFDCEKGEELRWRSVLYGEKL